MPKTADPTIPFNITVRDHSRAATPFAEPRVRRHKSGRLRPQRRPRSISIRHHLAWAALGASCSLYVVLWLALRHPLYPFGDPNYFDLRVYRGAGGLILHGDSLYAGRIWQWAPFTYPPITALLFTPLAFLPLVVDEVVVTVLNVAMLFAVIAFALRMRSGRGSTAPRDELWRSALVPAAAAAALWLEPISATISLGQINLFIALLIVVDLSRDDAARSKGILIGVAAGLKLTPLIFIPYLFFSRRRRPAIVALATFAWTVAISYALVPRDTQTYWGRLVFDPSRVGGCCVPANQSLRGAIVQIFPSIDGLWLLGITLPVGILGITLAVLSSHRGDEAMGFSRCATTGLLVSPVSWTHHWTLAVPAVLLVGLRFFQQRSRVGMTAVGGILIIAYSYLPKLMSKPGFYPRWGPPVGFTLVSAIYVLVGLAALTVAGLCEVRMRMNSAVE